MGGTFIVIDASDGSGKQTQTKLLVKRLVAEGVDVETIDFPRYYDNLFGGLIGECLAGEHGNFPKLDPYIASALYAGDRFESKKIIEDALGRGAVVIADRYVSSNQLAQGGKIKDARKRGVFLSWLDKLEHKVFSIPRPDAVIYLDVPVKMSLELLKKSVGKKRYLRGKKDLHEHNRKFLENSRASAQNLAKKNKNWFLVECARDGELLSKGDIHEQVYGIVKGLL